MNSVVRRPSAWAGLTCDPDSRPVVKAGRAACGRCQSGGQTMAIGRDGARRGWAWPSCQLPAGSELSCAQISRHWPGTGTVEETRGILVRKRQYISQMESYFDGGERVRIVCEIVEPSKNMFC